MKSRHHTPETILHKLREADRLLGESTPLVEVCKHLEITEATYCWCCNQYGGMKIDDTIRPKDLEKGNARLKRLGGEQALGIDMLTEVKWAKLLSLARRRAAADHLTAAFEVSQRRA